MSAYRQSCLTNLSAGSTAIPSYVTNAQLWTCLLGVNTEEISGLDLSIKAEEPTDLLLCLLHTCQGFCLHGAAYGAASHLHD